MSYRILEFRMGADTAEAFMLLGEHGEHEGTSVALHKDYLRSCIAIAKLAGDDPVTFLTARLDNLFSAAHEARMAVEAIRETAEATPAPLGGTDPNSQRKG